MNNTGFFFCGLLVGVVVSAAFGLDFFPAVTPGGGFATRPLDAPDGGSAALPPADRAALTAELDTASLKVTSLEKELSAAANRLQAKEAEVTTLEARLKAEAPDQAEALAKLGRAQSELTQERQRARRLEADLELSHLETYNLLRRFFGSTRSTEDAILISEYFATSAPEKLKGDLVDQLLKTNRDVIASLSPVSSQLARSRNEQLSGGLTPASTKTGVSRPEGAVLREDERGILDRRQTNDAADSARSAPVPGDRGAVRLPPPPGE